MKTFFTQSLLLAGLFSLVTFVSCQDDPTAMGLEIKDPGTKVLVIHDSTYQVNAYTFEAENYITVSTSNVILLGCMNDAALGTFYNDALVEFSPEENDADFDSLTVFESLKFELEFNSAYGDTTTLQNLTLYEIDSTMPIEDLNGKELGDLTLNGYFEKAKPLAQASYMTQQINDSTLTRIQFNLPEELGKRLIDASLVDYYDSNDDFNAKIFRGFYFESSPVNGVGAISTIKMNDSSRMVLYYRDSIADTVIHEFNYYFSSANKANIFKKQIKPNVVYNPMYTELFNAKEDSIVYVKNNNALYLKVRFEVKPWKDSVILINRAVLRIPCPELVGNDTLLYEPNSSFYCTRYYEKNDVLLYEHGDYTNYVPYPVYIIDNYLSVYVTNELQTAIKNDLDEVVIHIRGASGTTTANRTIFRGANQPENSLKLYVTYTKINQ